MYAILRIEKIKNRQNLRQVLSHNFRLRAVSNADSKLSGNNLYQGRTRYCDVISALESRYERYNLKPRKDAIEVFEVLLAASPEFFEQATREQVKEWMNSNIEFLKARFKGNILNFAVHFDETSPHIHALIAPFTDKNRLSMKDYIGGRAELSKLQTDYARAMSRFGLRRGREGSSLEHTKIKQFYNYLKISVPPRNQKVEHVLDLSPESKQEINLTKRMDEIDKKLFAQISNKTEDFSANNATKSSGKSKFKPVEFRLGIK